ncbi:hypothetical protein GGE67_004853 [Rhizobium leucaenae]|uniref:Uncharacterized protein n=1 Tax=Rhizobium leucaenae TaxID=29450 RepID=A0A7W6ZYI6_9HYPH|nr:hypothetical protein [Rhizobium leucaenae]MBB4571116.1 hypothetical protein [Rhizobium leucaenae]MBB6304210.1 hypothetical protein [Rhizobium leucaenae]
MVVRLQFHRFFGICNGLLVGAFRKFGITSPGIGDVRIRIERQRSTEVIRGKIKFLVLNLNVAGATFAPAPR